MEIFSYVLEGSLSHQDSLGTGSTVGVGGVQKMSAGTGILHSEFNPSKTEPLRFLQVWIIPDERGLAPSYDQKTYADADRRGRLTLIGSPDGRDGSIAFHQDVAIFAAILAPGQPIEHRVAPGRGLWLQIARGSADANGVRLDEGDGLAVENESALTVRGVTDSEFLLFDLV
jgi:redox-sensitive bicupin YhaK (pirin superfamily)